MIGVEKHKFRVDKGPNEIVGFENVNVLRVYDLRLDYDGHLRQGLSKV
jgi:hypothetical protein